MPDTRPNDGQSSKGESSNGEQAGGTVGRATRGGRRGNDSAQIIIISWRDIPAQVNAQKGREREQYVLSAKFQRSIDRAKRKGKVYTAHEDIAQWKRESRPCTDDLRAEMMAEAQRLEEMYSREHLGRLGFAGGWEPENRPLDAEAIVDDGEEEDPEDDPETAPESVSDWGTWSTKPDTAPATEPAITEETS
jgi:Virulence factor